MKSKYENFFMALRVVLCFIPASIYFTEEKSSTQNAKMRRFVTLTCQLIIRLDLTLVCGSDLQKFPSPSYKKIAVEFN